MIRNFPTVFNFNRLFLKNSTGSFVTNCRFSPIIVQELYSIIYRLSHMLHRKWAYLCYRMLERAQYPEALFDSVKLGTRSTPNHVCLKLQ